MIVRKKVGKSLSRFVGNWYVDYVSSASVDVMTTASPYTEEREQWSLGMDYLRANTTMRVAYVSSVESDFRTPRLGQLSISGGHVRRPDDDDAELCATANDIVGRSDDPTFDAREHDRQHYGVSMSRRF